MRRCAICQTQPKIFDLTVILVFIPCMRQEAEESSSHSAFNLCLGSNRPLNLSSEESCPPLNCYQSSDTLTGSYNGTPLLHMHAAVLARSLSVFFILALQRLSHFNNKLTVCPNVSVRENSQLQIGWSVLEVTSTYFIHK